MYPTILSEIKRDAIQNYLPQIITNIEYETKLSPFCGMLHYFLLLVFTVIILDLPFHSFSLLVNRSHLCLATDCFLLIVVEPCAMVIKSKQ